MESLKSDFPRLSPTWITDGHVDLEYKSYVILGYLQSVAAYFRSHRLYPVLADLIQHYKDLQNLKDKAELFESGTATVSGVDWEKLLLIYEKKMPESQVMEELMDIVSFAIPHFAESIQEGRVRYEEAEKLIALEAVGVMPLHQDEGYVILEDQENAENRVYSYHVTLYEKPGEKFKAIHTAYVSSYPTSLRYHFRQIKQELIRERPDWPNPAVFGAVSVKPLPFYETFFPIVRRLLAEVIQPAPGMTTGPCS
ncbi:MAG: hypothetical protein N2050_02640 [Flavobacteriales bacterium]|nr:hypothetical protein [Flavobacteriales bacterium]MCX7649438.1 hypothetical protein [Flavobacteriales bacterium]MDW8431596.1 hypothetical protein [Flavobacteriales bacterium]